MARYSTSVRTDTNKIDVKTVKYNVDINTTDYKVSLSRVGAHGSKGDSITRAYYSSDNHLLLEISDAQGNVVETIDAGSITTNFDINDLTQFDISNVENGDVLVYESASSSFKTHSFSTSNLRDVDNTNRSDGSVLVYSGTSSNYEATNTLNNANTTITGGNF